MQSYVIHEMKKAIIHRQASKKFGIVHSICEQDDDLAFCFAVGKHVGRVRDAELQRVGPPLRLAADGRDVWVAGPRGVARLDAEMGRWEAFTVPFDIPAGPVLDVFAIARERGGYGIWVDVDGYNLLTESQDVMLTSVMKNMDNSVFDVIEATMDGEFNGCGVYVGDLANGGVGIAPYHDLEDAVPDDLAAEVADLEEAIISGEISDTGCISNPDWCPGGLY